MTEDIDNKDVHLLTLLKKMDVPFYRKENLDKNNLLWLQKNLNIKNSDNPKYKEVINIINRKIENKEYTS
jgi:hypothetical protein